MGFCSLGLQRDVSFCPKSDLQHSWSSLHHHDWSNLHDQFPMPSMVDAIMMDTQCQHDLIITKLPFPIHDVPSGFVSFLWMVQSCRSITMRQWDYSCHWLHLCSSIGDDLQHEKIAWDYIDPISVNGQYNHHYRSRKSHHLWCINGPCCSPSLVIGTISLSPWVMHTRHVSGYITWSWSSVMGSWCAIHKSPMVTINRVWTMYKRYNPCTICSMDCGQRLDAMIAQSTNCGWTWSVVYEWCKLPHHFMITTPIIKSVYYMIAVQDAIQCIMIVPSLPLLLYAHGSTRLYNLCSL